MGEERVTSPKNDCAGGYGYFNKQNKKKKKQALTTLGKKFESMASLL